MRPIDADGLEKSIKEDEELKSNSLAYLLMDLMTCYIDEAPTIDVQPFVHGHWVNPHWRNTNYCCDCSECHAEAMHKEFRWHEKGIYPICPNCGAKMYENAT